MSTERPALHSDRNFYSSLVVEEESFKSEQLLVPTCDIKYSLNSVLS